MIEQISQGKLFVPPVQSKNQFGVWFTAVQRKQRQKAIAIHKFLGNSN